MATASIVNLWNRMMGLAKAGTSGMDDQDSFNGKIDSVQKSLGEILIDLAEENTKVTDALNWLKKTSGNLTPDGTGMIALPSDYLHIDSLSFIANAKKYPGTKLRTDEVDMTGTSPIRGDNATAPNEQNYYFQNGALYLFDTSATISMRYYKQVPTASIVLTAVSDGSGDYVTPSVGVEFGWPVQMFNLLLYMTLEQYAIEVKENLLIEYAQYGITKEMIRSRAGNVDEILPRYRSQIR